MENDENEALEDLLQDPDVRKHSDSYHSPLPFTESEKSKSGKFLLLKIVLIIVLISPMLWAVFRIKSYLDPFYLAAEATRWPTTMGNVLSASVSTTDAFSGATNQTNSLPIYKPVINYSYKVGNVRFGSSRFSLATRANFDGWSEPDSPKEIIKRHPAGSPIKVYYNPKDPKLAVIQPGYEPDYFSISSPFDFLGIMFALCLPLYILITYRFDPRYNYENQLNSSNYYYPSLFNTVWGIIFLVCPCGITGLLLGWGLPKLLPTYGTVYLFEQVHRANELRTK